LEARGARTVEALLAEVLPGTSETGRRFAAELLMMSMGAVAETLTEQPRPRAEVDSWARATAEMYCAYLEKLAGTATKAP
jgi:hypothetical protein